MESRVPAADQTGRPAGTRRRYTFIQNPNPRPDPRIFKNPSAYKILRSVTTLPACIANVVLA